MSCCFSSTLQYLEDLGEALPPSFHLHPPLVIEAVADNTEGGEDEGEDEDDEGDAGPVVQGDAAARDQGVEQVPGGAESPCVASTSASAAPGVPQVSVGATGRLPSVVTQTLTRVWAVAVVDIGARVTGNVAAAVTAEVLPHPEHGALGVQHPRAIGGHHKHHWDVNLV